MSSRLEQLVDSMHRDEREELSRILRRRGHTGHEKGPIEVGGSRALVLVRVDAPAYVVLSFDFVPSDPEYWINEHTCPVNLASHVVDFVSVDGDSVCFDPHGSIRYVAMVETSHERDCRFGDGEEYDRVVTEMITERADRCYNERRAELNQLLGYETEPVRFTLERELDDWLSGLRAQGVG